MSEATPSYAPRSRPLPRRILDESAFTHARLKPAPGRFTLANLRVRLTLNIVAISFVVLIFMGTMLAITGVIQVRQAQDTQSREVVASVRAFAQEVSAPGAAYRVSSTYDALFGYLSRAPHVGAATMVGYIDGAATLYQAGHDDSLVRNAALMRRVGEVVRPATAAHAVTVRVDGRDYRVTVVPITVVGDVPGALALIQDSGEALAPTLDLVKVFGGVSLVVLSLVALVTWMGMSRLLKPLARLRAMTRSVVSADDLSQRLPVSSHDDLGDLAASFNDMVDRLQNGFEEQRHLLNDAGHELRTPLTVVQGHLEIMNCADRADVEATRDLVLEEVRRMHRMGEDLIDVARSVTPDFVHPERVSIPDLTMDVLQHAARLGPQRVALDALGEGEVTADPQRLKQALLQLVENATKFSPANARIFIGSATGIEPELLTCDGQPVACSWVEAPSGNRPDTGWVALWVRDQGIGVEPRNARRIFDRFARVDHQLPGSGLGLTIVAAIAAAHHGSLEVRSVPGHGSVFALFIPLEIARAAKEGETHG